MPQPPTSILNNPAPSLTGMFFPFALLAVSIPSLFYPRYQGKPKPESTMPSFLWDELLLELLIFLGQSKDIPSISLFF